MAIPGNIIKWIVELGIDVLNLDRSGKLWNEYQGFVDELVQAGLSHAEATNQVIMEMIDTSPEFAEARAQIEAVANELPKQYRAELDSAFEGARTNAETYRADLAGTRQDYAKRESRILGMLDEQGQQELKDIERVYGEQQGEALADLGARGLAGSGVGASVRGGFTTGMTDELARSRERTSAMRADYATRLSGDTLGFGERAATLGYGAGRDIYGDQVGNLERAYGFEMEGRLGLADALYGRGEYAIDKFHDTSRDYLDWIGNLGPVPPDTSGAAAGFGSTMDRLGRGQR